MCAAHHSFKSVHTLMVAHEQGMRFWIDVPEPQLHGRQRMITDIGELSALGQRLFLSQPTQLTRLLLLPTGCSKSLHMQNATLVADV